MARFSLKWLFGILAGVGLCYVGGQGATGCLILASLVMFFFRRPFTVGFAIAVLGIVAMEIGLLLTFGELVRIDSTPDGLRARAAMERKNDRLLRLNAIGLFLSGLLGGVIANGLSTNHEKITHADG